MKKMMVMMIGWMSLFVSGFAEAQVIKPGVTYYGGAQLEIAGSGATFTVPGGWSGQYNPAEKSFEMLSPTGESVGVAYEGKSYADAIAFAKKPITTSEGIVFTPLLNETEKFKDRLEGEAFAYTGTALLFMDVGAVDIVIKLPSGKAMTIGSGGMGRNFKGFISQIGQVMPSLTFAGEARTKSSQAKAKHKDRKASLSGKRNGPVEQGVTYAAGAVIEMPNSGITFTVPFGWTGKYDTINKMFSMTSSSEQLMEVVYKGRSYVDAVNDAYEPFTTDGNVKFTNIKNGELSGLPFTGTMFTYAGIYQWRDVGAVRSVIKTPAGKAFIMGTAGMGNNFTALASQFDLFVPSLKFGIVAGVQLAGEMTEASFGPPKEVHYSQEDPFKAHGNRKLSKYVHHKTKGLFWDSSDYVKKYVKSKISHWSGDIRKYYLVNSTATKRLSFCTEKINTEKQYQGTFLISTRKTAQSPWKRADIGRYQIYQNADVKPIDMYSGGVKVEGLLDTMFIDRKKGQHDIVLVEMIAKDTHNRYWFNKYAFNGEVYIAQGINQSCLYKANKDLVLISKCQKEGGGKSCRGKVYPKTYDTAGNNREDMRERNERSSSSSSGSYDTHFGTTSSGAIIFSSPSGSMCSGC